MKCSDVQRVLPEILEGVPDTAFATEFETHLQSCPDCSDVVADLKLISSQARQMAATEEPSPRVWLGIAAQLRAEGLISDSLISNSKTRKAELAAATRPVLVPSPPRRRWSPLWLAPVAAALVAAGSYMVSHKPARQVAEQQAPAAPTPTPKTAPTPVTTPDTKTTAAVTPRSVPTPTPPRPEQKPAVSRGKSSDDMVAAAEPVPSAEDQQFLSVVSTRAPSMRAAYENQLAAVNADILETQEYVKRNPGDLDARQHLMDAYQQKALLYQIALDRIQ